MAHLFKINDRMNVNGQLVRIVDIGDAAESDGQDITPVTVRRPAQNPADERDCVYLAHELDAAVKIGGGFKVGDIFTRADSASATITEANLLNYVVTITDGDTVETAITMTHDELLAWHLAKPSPVLQDRVKSALSAIPHKNFSIVKGGLVVVYFDAPINGQLLNLKSRIQSVGLLHPRIDPEDNRALLCEYPYAWVLEAKTADFVQEYGYHTDAMAKWEAEDTCEECGAPTSPQQHNLCERCRIREADIAAAEATFLEASTPTDPKLTATANEIRRLQQKVADLETQLAHAIDRAETAEDDLDTLREKNQAANRIRETIVAPKQKQIFPFRDITAIELQQRINDGWEILHMQFMPNPAGEDRLNVVLSRECPAPQPEQVVRQVTVVPDTAVTIIPAAAQREIWNNELVAAAQSVLRNAPSFIYHPLQVQS